MVSAVVRHRHDPILRQAGWALVDAGADDVEGCTQVRDPLLPPGQAGLGIGCHDLAGSGRVIAGGQAAGDHVDRGVGLAVRPDVGDDVADVVRRQPAEAARRAAQIPKAVTVRPLSRPDQRGGNEAAGARPTRGQTPTVMVASSSDTSPRAGVLP